MKLLFIEQVVEFEQNLTVEEIIEKINELLGNQFYFSHLVIDGKEVIEAPEDYLLQNLTHITELEVIAVEAKQFVGELLLSSEEYVERAVPHITDLSDAFYHHPNQENWISLSELFEGIQWLASMISTIDQSIIRPKNWDVVVEAATTLQNELGELEEALENTDTILVGDILQYEILPAFETFGTEIKLAIDTEGIRYDLN